MDDALAIGTHCGSLDGTVTLNIQIKSGMKNFVSGHSLFHEDWIKMEPVPFIAGSKVLNYLTASEE